MAACTPGGDDGTITSLASVHGHPAAEDGIFVTSGLAALHIEELVSLHQQSQLATVNLGMV
jgi:hypothetical protein